MVCDSVQGSYCMWEMVCDKVVCVSVCVWSYCMLSLCVCVKVLYVKLLYVKFLRVKLLYVRDGMWQSCVCECVWSYCMLSHGMWQCAREAAGGGEGEGARDTESKTRTPHKVVGNNSGSRKRAFSNKWALVAISDDLTFMCYLRVFGFIYLKNKKKIG